MDGIDRESGGTKQGAPGRSRRREGALLAGLVRIVEAGSVAFSLCEVSSGVNLTGAPLESVSALIVLAGVLHMQSDARTMRMAPTDHLLLLPAGVTPSMIADANAPATIVDGVRCIRHRGGIPVVDATAGRPSELTVAAARVVGSTRDDLADAHVIPLNGPVCHQLLTILRAEIARQQPSGAVIASLMSACVALALRNAVDGSSGPQRSDYRDTSIARATAAVIAQPAAAHSVNTLAEVAGMSRSTFVRQFTAVMKCSPMAFLQQTRLKEAAAMLRSSTLSVQAIAAATGFASRSHFSRVFRTAFGTDPTDYRAQPDPGDR